jgi:adenylate kinase family enzyme
MRRVSVVGSSGSGKTTVARRLADALSAPHVELDALYWGPEWSAATRDEIVERVEAATAGDSWVVDGNYWSRLGPRVWTRADTVVWVNPPRWRATWQSLTRAVRRSATRETLWAGNRESWRGLMFWRGEESILWWAWTTYSTTQDRYSQAMDDPAWQHLTFYRLRTRRDADRLVARLRNEGDRR